MNIKITHNWLLEYLDTKATPEEIQKYLSLCGPSVERVEKINNDYIYEIEVTSNRIDTASVYGIAREAYAILNRFGIKADLKPPALPKPKSAVANKHTCPLQIADDKHLVKRVAAAVMDNIQIGKSPQYIKDRLEKVGIRSLNNIIDITNYVMVELGHPAHVMDYDRIKTGKLIFRHAKKGETLVTLDGKKYVLNERDVVVDDGTGRIVDLPGIMGTKNSVVTSTTKRAIIFIESNNPQTIRQTSMRLGIRTMAATYDEKNVDPELTGTALRRVIQLFESIANANLTDKPVDIYHEPVKPKSVSIAIADVNKLVGIEIPKNNIIKMMVDLEFILQSDNKDVLTFQVPSYRHHDIFIKEDLVEEIARIYGYFNLPNNLQPPALVKQPKEMAVLFSIEQKIKYFLKHIGLHEVVNYSMISKEMIENNGLTDLPHLELKNTISEEIRYMRRFLMPSLIKNIKDNEGREEKLQLFEIAKTYIPRPGDLPLETYRLGIATNTDFFDLKGIIDALLHELNIGDLTIGKGSHPVFSKNNQGKITKSNDFIVEFGKLKNDNIFLADFDIGSLIKYAKLVSKYKPVNPYAIVKLDLTFEPKKTYADIKKKAFDSSKLLSNIEFIGKYENKISLRFYFSASDRNITEEEAKGELEKIKASL